MRKIFTLAAGLVLGAFAFSASADTYDGVTFTKVSNDQLKVTWTDGMSLSVSADAQNGYLKAYVTGSDDVQYELGKSDFTANNNYSGGSNLTFNIGGLGLSDGDYTFTLPAGFTNVYIGSNWVNTSYGEMSWEFTIGEGGGGDDTPTTPQYEYTLSENGVNEYYITFGTNSLATNNTGVAYLKNDAGETFNLTQTSGFNFSEFNLVFYSDGWSTDKLRVYLANGNLGLTSGTYTLVLPAGYLKIGGVATTADIEIPGLEYVGSESFEVATSEELAPVVLENKKLTFTWLSANNQQVLSITNANSSDKITLKEVGSSTTYQADPKEDLSFSNTSLIFDLSYYIDMKYLKAGASYTVTIPEGFVTITAYDNGVSTTLLNAEQTFTFVNAAISTVPATWNPEGGELTDNTTVTASWGYALTHLSGANEIVAESYGVNSATSVTLTYGDQVTIDGNNISIDLSNLEPDTYTVKIPAAYVSFTVDGTTYVNAATEQEFTVPAPTATYSVSLYFLDGEEDDFVIDDPWNKVFVLDLTTLEPVTKDSAYLPFTYEAEAKLNIYPSDLDYEIVVTVDGDVSEDSYILLNEDGEYTLTLTPEADGAEINVRVYTKGGAPKEGDDDKNTVNFTLEAFDDDMGNLAELLSVSYFNNKGDWSEWGNVPVEFEGESATASIAGGITITFTPKEGYMLSIFDTDNGPVSISQPSDPEGEWTAYINENASGETINLQIIVMKAYASVMLNFTSSSDNINGNPQDYVTFTVEPEEVLEVLGELSDENKIYLYDDENVTFTVTPVTNFTATVKITDGDDEVSLEGLAEYDSNGTLSNGTYTFVLSSAANGLVFTFDIADNMPGTDVTLKFVGDETLEVDAYTCVTVVADGINAVNVDSDEFTYTVPFTAEAVDFTFTPKTGYVIEVTCQDKDGEAFGDIVEGEGELAGTYQLRIPGENETEIPEGVVITINVKGDNTGGITDLILRDENTVIYNLQGIRVNADNLSTGLYIVNGQKAYIRR